MVDSASIAVADRQLGNAYFYTQRHLIRMAMSVVLGVAVCCMPIATWQKWSLPGVLIGLVGLVVVLIPGLGHNVNGGARWISLGVMNLQVSEWVKLSLIVYVSDYLCRQQQILPPSDRRFLVPLALLMGVGILLMLEPDFGAFVVAAATMMRVAIMTTRVS
ncbi:MAG: FtsW/RodA/SpoVE family cell cycle protein, partial [Pseudomonadota bacterium]